VATVAAVVSVVKAAREATVRPSQDLLVTLYLTVITVTIQAKRRPSVALMEATAETGTMISHYMCAHLISHTKCRPSYYFILYFRA
jgi:hypothetical protein